MPDELVSLNEVKDRFYSEDLELLGNTDALVEITVSDEQDERGQQDVRLRFGNPGEPSYSYWAFLEYAGTAEDLQTAFGIKSDEQLWRCGNRTELTIDEAWECMEDSGEKIVSYKECGVEIALYRGQDEDGTVSPRVGIQLHFGEPGKPVVEGSDAYEFVAWMDPTYTLSGQDFFALDDVLVAFNIDPNIKMWLVGDPDG
jgi:hypothetical protein